MAIHPQPSEQPIRETANELEKNESETWMATKRLMSSLVPHSFQVNYRHRLILVRLVADCLVLPEFSKESAVVDAPLFEGALPHLRASLYAFGMAAMSPFDAHLAQCGLGSVAIQTGEKVVVREEWGRLLHRLTDDHADYNCCHDGDPKPGLSLFTQESTSFCPHRARGQLLEYFLIRISESRHYADSEFLQHALGSLTDAIEWKVDSWTKAGDDDPSSANEKEVTDVNEKEEETNERHEASSSDDSEMEDSGKHSKGPKGKAEETRDVDSVDEDEESHEKASDSSDNDDNNDPGTKTPSNPPCLLASLLIAATPLFYFLLPIANNVDDDKGEESEDSHHRDMLISCGIQLLHHWNSAVAREASKLLVLGFCYGPEDMMSDYAGPIFESTKLSIEEALNCGTFTSNGRLDAPIEGMVATLSQKSPIFAKSLLSFLLSNENREQWKLGETSCKDSLVYRLVAAVSTACPTAAQKHKEVLIEKLEDVKKPEKAHLIAALLSCRKSRLFSRGDESLKNAMLKSTAIQDTSGWDLYLLARHAMVTGNAFIAKVIYERLVASTTSEIGYMWLASLQKVAEAESALSSNGAKGIPFSTMQLHSARFDFNSIASLNSTVRGNLSFQIRYLNSRLDFLDLLGSIRQLTREMRLTGLGPKKHTRPSLHLRNAVKFLNVLAAKYLSLYRQYGLFICQQSRTSLRTLQALCRFVSSAARSTFIDVLPEVSMNDFQMNAIQALTLPKGDASHPLTILMRRLDASVLKDMNGSIDAKIRAAAMLEIIDGILMAPNPFPRAFMDTKQVPHASFRLSIDTDLLDDHGDDDEVDDEVDISPGTSITFFASGTIPESLVKKASIPFCIVLLWHSFASRGKGKDGGPVSDEKTDDDGTSISDIRSLSSSLNLEGVVNPTPSAVSLSSSGTFFLKVESGPILEEGLYTIQTRLGCRDIRGGEWELPVGAGTHSMSVRVSRSR